MNRSESETQTIPHAHADSPRAGRDLPDASSIAAFLIPFALIVFLGLREGGYDQFVHGAVGAAAWWLVALGVAVAALPSARVGRSGWIALAVLAAFAGWTAIGVSWSSSSGRSTIEVARVLAYLGVFGVALLIGGRGRLRLTLGAVGAGCVVIAVIAMLSRLQPSWFPSTELPETLAGVQSRLGYPVVYWNALAGLIAIGLPLVLWAVVTARSLALRAVAAAAVPAICLASYFTFSRGGIIAAALALAVLILLFARRLSLLAPLAILAALTGVVVWQASIRAQLSDALPTATAGGQGDRMLLIVIGAGLLAAAALSALALLERSGRLPRAPVVPRRWALRLAGAVAVVSLVGFVGFGGPGKVSDGFEDFKAPTGLSTTSDRLGSVAGNGRWQYWSTAADAGSSAPLQGIGPGTFVFYWDQNRDIDNGPVLDAHSLFVETYAELGIVGLLLIAGFVAMVIAIGVRRALRAAGERRDELAAATAATVAFAVGAGADWLWEMAIVPVAFLFVAAAILRPDPAEEEPEGVEIAAPARLPLAARIGIPIAALVAIAAIAVPTASDLYVETSQQRSRDGDVEGALAAAERAAEIEPWAAEPRVQQAGLLERVGDLSRAATAARAAIERETANWETWYAFSVIQAQRPGKTGSAVRALRTAQELDPFNTLLDPQALAR